MKFKEERIMKFSMKNLKEKYPNLAPYYCHETDTFMLKELDDNNTDEVIALLSTNLYQVSINIKTNLITIEPRTYKIIHII